ncbi:MAG: hypothetical protein LBU32_15625 [Clostridiales bacterium]|jgi:hypothetical protein|nr:hypothetical protein [Clostridiales bacterium]
MKRIFAKNARLDPAMFKDLKPPPLILDALWQEHFRGRKTDRINFLEVKIKDLMKENAKNSQLEKELNAKKRQCLRQIIELSPGIHENGSADAKKAASVCQDAVLSINKDLEAAEKRSGELASELDEACRELLLETVSIIYPMLRESQSKLKELEPKAQKLRLELKSLVEEQIRHEEDAARTYQLLHNLVGQEIANRLDDLYGRGVT